MSENQPIKLKVHFSRLPAVAERLNLSRIAWMTWVLAGTTLVCLELVVWKTFITPHANLVRCHAMEAIVTETRLEEVGEGQTSTVFPRVTYQFMVDGVPMESSVLRHPRSVQSESGEGQLGEIRFQGPQRRQWAAEYLAKYRVGQEVTAWVTHTRPAEAMLLRQELDIQPFLMGLVPAIFVPFFWMFFGHLLLALTGRPAARWIGCGWAALTFASLYPLSTQYQHLLGPGQSSLFIRFQEVGLHLALVVFCISFLPTTFRSALGIALTLCIFLGIGVGVFRTVLFESFNPHANGDFFLRFIQSVEYGLYGGGALGLLMGALAKCGWIWVWPRDEDPSPFEPE